MTHAPDPVWDFVENPYTGRREWQPYGGALLRPLVDVMRDADGLCGPDARLWTPKWYIRIWRNIAAAWMWLISL